MRWMICYSHEHGTIRCEVKEYLDWFDGKLKDKKLAKKLDTCYMFLVIDTSPKDKKKKH